jgi:signal transduction histidine kinase
MRKTTPPPSALIVTPAGTRAELARGRPAASAQARNGAGPAEASVYLAEDHERIALGLNEVVVRRLFAAGLDLHAALALMGDHRAAAKVDHAIDELDQAIQDLRNIIFNHLSGDRPVRPCVLAP